MAGEESVIPTETKTVEETADFETEEIQISESPSEIEESSLSEKIDINTADAQGLMTLPGIGESRAAAIIEYRRNVGAFKEIDEIMNVKGIGDGIFQKIKSLICVK